MAAELGDVLVAPRCPGGEYSLIPSPCTSLLGSSNSKTPNAPQMSHFTLGVSRGVFPSWDCHCPPPHVAPVPMLFPMAVHLLGCCRTGVVCICCSACGVLAAILLLLTGLHQLQCTEGLCSPPHSLPQVCTHHAAHSGGLHHPPTHPIARDQSAPTVVRAVSLHPPCFSCPTACGAFAPAVEHAVVLHPSHCLGPICTHHGACNEFAPTPLLASLHPPWSIHPTASIPLHCASAPTP